MNQPFSRNHLSNQPGIVGARWWQESLAIMGDPVARRQTLQNLALVGASLLGVGVIGSVVCHSSQSDDRLETRDALTMQRDYGWNFGAETEKLTFDGQQLTAFDRAALANLPTDLAPSSPALRPYVVPTLLQSTTAMPRLTLQGRTSPVQPLRDVLMPIQTAAMREAYRQGKALASLFTGLPTDRLVIVDLDGPASVAFAAGAASVLDPVFVLDNWPHPLGVVPAHLTLAAAAFYQPLFARVRAARRVPAVPLFVLDRARLTTYTSDSNQFDNRHVARLPLAEDLKKMGITRVLYVTPSAANPLELDDLNADFVAYGSSGVDVKMVAASDFRPDPSSPPTPPPGLALASPDDWPPYYYGGDAGSHEGFWLDYRWNAPRKPTTRAPMGTSGLAGSYRPTTRPTPFAAVGTGPAKARPTGMGMMPVVVAAATGVVIGSAVSRSGTISRLSGSWGGGG